MHRFVLAAPALALAIACSPATSPAAASPAAQAAAPAALVLPAPKAGRGRPLVAIVTGKSGAETTDFIAPYGVLKESGLAEVRAVATAPGPIQLMRTLKIQPDQTTAQFDAEAPEGADIVIVPAQMQPKDPALAAWVNAQADKGAVIVSICEGARVLAAAGLLEGRRATSHWHALEGLEKAYPGTAWVRDRRYVQDGPIISTTGVSASVPASLALVEAIGGRAAAAGVAGRMGVTDWGPAHRTGEFSLTSADYSHAVRTLAAVWSHETVETPITDGIDEVALALATDTWVRGLRARVATTSPSEGPIRSRHGLLIIPDARPKPGAHVVPLSADQPARELDRALEAMGRRYGPVAARLARMGLEHPAPAD